MRVGTVWDVPTSFLSSHDTLGWDGQWDAGMRGGTVWDIPTPFLSSGGTLGWDGQWDAGMRGSTVWGCWGTGWDVMGWTVDTVSGTNWDIYSHFNLMDMTKRYTYNGTVARLDMCDSLTDSLCRNCADTLCPICPCKKAKNS